MGKNLEMNPRISVVMPVFNAENHLRDSIESILRQTFSDFEFLIFNDGSTDKSSEIIDEYKSVDSRIIHVVSKKNQGYLVHLNHGLEMANAQYIARMDADDISEPDRLERQFEFMQENKEIGVCGAYYEILGEGRIVKPPVENDAIKIHLLKGSMIAHPVAFLNKKLLAEKGLLYYDPNYYTAEDYELWVRCALKVKLHNIPMRLIKIRKHDQSISKVKNELQQRIAQKIKLNHLSVIMDRELSEQEKSLSKQIFNEASFCNVSFIKMNKLFCDLLNRNKQCDLQLLKIFLRRYWFTCFSGKKNFSYRDLRIVFSPFFSEVKSRRQKLGFIIKCLLPYGV